MKKSVCLGFILVIFLSLLFIHNISGADLPPPPGTPALATSTETPIDGDVGSGGGAGMSSEGSGLETESGFVDETGTYLNGNGLDATGELSLGSSGLWIIILILILVFVGLLVWYFFLGGKLKFPIKKSTKQVTSTNFSSSSTQSQIATVLGVFGIIALVCFGIYYYFGNSSLLVGNAILDNYDDTYYASPISVFSGEQLFSISPENFTLTNDSQTINMIVEVENPGGYIYKQGYYFGKNQWVPFIFSNPPIGQSNWITDKATKNLEISASNTLRNGNYNFIVAYACKKYFLINNSWIFSPSCDISNENCEWKCGCESDKVSCEKWMLQSFEVQGVVEGLEPSVCQYDSQCNADNVCINGVCTPKISGVGTPEEPFLISTLSDLLQIKNDLDGVYNLTSNIDASGTLTMNNGAGWLPITNFNGTFEGNNVVIENLYIDQTKENSSLPNVGLFSEIASGGIIRDIILDNVTIIADPEFSDYIGGVVGVNNGGIIENVIVSGGTITSASGAIAVGGVAGLVTGISKENSLIQNVLVENLVIDGGNSIVGSIVGSVAGGSISGGTSLIDGVGVSGVTLTGKTVGGLVGRLSTESTLGCTNSLYPAVINNSYVIDSTISSYGESPLYIGGLVGRTIGCNIYKVGLIKNSYAVAKLIDTSSNGGAYVGGILGYSSATIRNILNSFSNVEIISNSFNGGGISGMYWGYDYPASYLPVSNVFWNTGALNSPIFCYKSNIDGSLENGCTAIQNDASYFKNKNNQPMASWDFVNTWAIDPAKNDGYPYLKWQNL